VGSELCIRDRVGHAVVTLESIDVKLVSPQGADDFLGTQGDQWDTQSDMFCALLGALTTVIFLARFHCRQLRRFGLITRAPEAITS
uniref:DUF2238 domain-containing protein n=1 Tax=Klebsiella pneumoniae TaxID=573 RepID=UPI0025543E9E